MTKVLDVFGRAEGVCFAAALYSLGYLITAGATDVKVYVFARALSALGGQGIQLAQQIIVAGELAFSPLESVAAVLTRHGRGSQTRPRCRTAA